MAWRKEDDFQIPHMFYRGPCWVKEIPCNNKHYQGPLLAIVTLCTMDPQTKKFTIPCNSHEFLWNVVGTDSGGNPHIIHADRFQTLDVAKARATRQAKAQAH